MTDKPEKLNLNSMDISAQNRAKLKSLFPSVFTETAGDKGELVESIDFEKLKSELGTFSDLFESRRERFGLDWPGKKDCMKLIQEPSFATLKPARDESVNFDGTENLFIEGDNLEVLKLLQKSYYGKVKMIYIDPPYNTGKEFIYPDKYSESLETYLEYAGLVDSEGRKFSTNTPNEGRFHTKWLNMMYPRLYLARNLLREDGVIFISIDDNEVANLRKLCDEIFGEENFIGIFVINSTPNARDYGHIGKMHEYVIFYSKNVDFAKTHLLPETDKTFKFKDEISGFNIHPLYNSNVAFTPANRPNLYYPFYLYPDSKIGSHFYEIGFEERAGAIKIYPPKSQREGVQFVWRWGKEKAAKTINKEIIGYKTDRNGYRIVQKMRHNAKLIRSLLLEKIFSTRKGTAEVESLFEQKIFPFPKPLALLKTLLKAATIDSDLILDFFAGSCTTAHAVLDLNKEDGGNRKFIMVQLPEPCNEKSEAFKAGYKTIADIGKERIRRVIKRIEEERAAKEKEEQAQLFRTGDRPVAPSSLDLGFKVLKLDKSNFKPWEKLDANASEEEIGQQLEMFIDHIDPNSSQEDILYEILLKAGFSPVEKVEKLELAGKTVFSIADGALLICLEDEITRELIDAVAEAEPMQFICLDQGFKGNDQLKTNAVQTFAARNQGRDKAGQIVFRTV